MKKEIHIEESLATGDNPHQEPLFTKTHSIRTFSPEELIAFYRASFPGESLFSTIKKLEKVLYELEEKTFISGYNHIPALAKFIILSLAIGDKYLRGEGFIEEVWKEVGNMWRNGLKFDK